MAARAEEVLFADVGQLDLDNKRCGCGARETTPTGRRNTVNADRTDILLKQLLSFRLDNRDDAELRDLRISSVRG